MGIGLSKAYHNVFIALIHRDTGDLSKVISRLSPLVEKLCQIWRGAKNVGHENEICGFKDTLSNLALRTCQGLVWQSY
jgi:hypothetical protein